MSEPVKKKLCWNCEGSVAKQLETCPYCGVYLSPTDPQGNLAGHEERDLLTPPYPQEKRKEERSYAAPFPSESKDEEGEEVTEGEGSFLAPLVLFFSGFTFGLFGLALWLFSEKGRLTLSWNADWGPLFMLLALPLLFFGGRSLWREE